MLKNIQLLFFLCLFNVLTFSQNSDYPKREVRALWITTAFNLDWPSSSSLSARKQKEEFIEILEHHKKKHINTLFLQVRVAADALYNSKYEPWSKVLTGKKGKGPDYDPLQFAIEECHKRNIELHTWFNIFRAETNPKALKKEKNHIVRKHPKWFLKTTKGYFFNPGVSKVHTYLNRVVLDVVENYDIDGIHFDDYFYPQEVNGVKIKDYKLWKKANKKGDSLDIKDWRRENINDFIKLVSKAIKKSKPYVKFGISPAAVWRHETKDPEGSHTKYAISSYDDLYGDSRKWLAEGWVDYLVPQLYQSTKHPHADFRSVLDWWDKESYERHHLYVGHAIYKIGTKNYDWNNPRELFTQISLTRKYKNINGSAFFRAGNFNRKTAKIEKNIEQSFYTYLALQPTMPWLDSIPPNTPQNLRIKKTKKGNLLRWTPPNKASDNQIAYRYLVYRVALNAEINFNHPKYIVAYQPGTSFLDIKSDPNTIYLYFVTALDRLGNESTEFIGGSIGNITK